MKKGLYFFLCVVVLVAGMCWRSNTRKSITSPTNFFEMQYETLEKAATLMESKCKQIDTLRSDGSAVVTFYMTGRNKGNYRSRSFFDDAEWDELRKCWLELEKYAYIEVDYFRYMGEYAIQFYCIGKNQSSERIKFSYVYTPISDSRTVLDYICFNDKKYVSLQDELWNLIE